MRTDYRIDDFQESHFVIRNLDELPALAQIDLGPLYGGRGDGIEHQPGDVLRPST